MASDAGGLGLLACESLACESLASVLDRLGDLRVAFAASRLGDVEVMGLDPEWIGEIAGRECE